MIAKYLLLKYVDLFEHMKISETIYEGVLEPFI